MILVLCYFLQVVQTFGDGSLGTIDKRFIVAGSFLKSIKDDHAKLDCLNAFAESYAIIEWILKETKGSD